MGKLLTMKHPKVIALLLLAGLIAPLTISAQSDKDIKAVKKVVKLYEDALNDHSLDGIVAVFDIDAVVLPPNAPAAAGHGAIREQYKAVTGSEASLEITLEIQETIISDDIAYVWSLNYGKIKLKDGTESAIDSKSLMILRKSTDGWKVHRYMFNANDAPD